MTDLADTFRKLMATVEGFPYFAAEQMALSHVILAEAQALADVRTLDDWTAAHPDESPAVPVPLPASVGGWCVFMMGGEFTGATPDEARAKAAAYVKKTDATT